MTEFVFSFFHETVTCDIEKAYFFLWFKVLKNLSKEVLLLNNGFNNYTVCFKVRVPPSTADMKIHEVFFEELVGGTEFENCLD